MECVSRKHESFGRVKSHLDKHELSETVSIVSYDLMHKSGNGLVYGARIFQGIKSYGIGVAAVLKVWED